MVKQAGIQSIFSPLAIVFLAGCSIFPYTQTIPPNLHTSTKSPEYTQVQTLPVGTTISPLTTKTPSYTTKPTITHTSTPTGTSTMTSTPTYESVDFHKGPYLIYTGSNTEMKICWQSEGGNSYLVEWGTDETYQNGKADVLPAEENTDLYSYVISDLQPGTKYLYRISTNQQASGGSFFSAPPQDSDILKFVVYGDTQKNTGIHDGIASQIIQLSREDPVYQSIVIIPGDLVTYGDMPEVWDSELFDPQYRNIRAEFANIAVIPAIGNHEGGGLLYKTYFSFPFVSSRYWSFDYGPAHFVMLDQYVPYLEGTKQFRWMEEDLSNTVKKWIFVVFHEPGYSAGGGFSDIEEIKKQMQPVFENYGVTAVFSGHNHYYARAEVRGILHFTVGTGGGDGYAPRSNHKKVVKAFQANGFLKIEIQEDTLNGWFVDKNNNILDQFIVQK